MRYLTLMYAFFAAAPQALACSVCGVYGEDPSGTPFLQGTALLSLTPLLFMGGAVYYFYRRYKQAALERHVAEAAALAPLAPLAVDQA